MIYKSFCPINFAPLLLPHAVLQCGRGLRREAAQMRYICSAKPQDRLSINVQYCRKAMPDVMPATSLCSSCARQASFVSRRYISRDLCVFLRKNLYMRIDIITVLPEMIENFFDCSIMKRARDKGLAEIYIHNLRHYTKDKYHSVDDYPFGGFSGMVMKIEPIECCINALKSEREYDEVIFTTPDGEQFKQSVANELSLKQNLIILCGHFKGIDFRIREHLITREISIGDYVLTGGELAAAVITDAVVRIIPGVISDEQSALSDSFQDNLLAAPIYTRPADYKGWKVPDILLSGHEAKIKEWELQQSIERTRKLRPDLLEE